MSISDIEIKRKMRRLCGKTAVVYLAAAVLCLVITNVYARFGHGIRSDSMDFMFLYPLLGGTLVFLTAAGLSCLLPVRLSVITRIGCNLYHSGIASLTSAAMLTGIMEIAGTGSPWISYLFSAGILLLAAGLSCLTNMFRPCKQ